MSDGWLPIHLAPKDEEVWTKIDDGNGVRNKQKLTLRGHLWYTDPDPDKGMYVYYSPTHWKRKDRHE